MVGKTQTPGEIIQGTNQKNMEKVKVGVITMHRVRNYGSVLQAYATQRTVEKLGYACELIDYQYPNDYQFERGEPRPAAPSLKSMLAKKLGLRSYYRQQNRMERFVTKYLRLSRHYKNRKALMASPPHYDIYLTGSDQVWNPRFMKGDPTFFFDYVEKGKKISYAASFSAKHLNEDYEASFRTYLQSYSALSVREQGGADIIQSLLGRQAEVVLDPTLLLSRNEWEELVYHNGRTSKFGHRNYILVYMLGYAFDPKPTIYEVIHRLSQETKLEVFSIGRMPESFDGAYTPFEELDPLEFVRMFLDAKYVVTSSFHGTAFAVNCGKRVFSIVGDADSSDDRQSSLLHNLGIPQASIPVKTPLQKIDFADYDQTSVSKRLEDYRQSSIHWLEKALSN